MDDMSPHAKRLLLLKSKEAYRNQFSTIITHSCQKTVWVINAVCTRITRRKKNLTTFKQYIPTIYFLF